ncbi:hypothetical protein C8Q79DRAFT_695358 [Trametes meyenii]|nr:hypothetical protein C8Q79DRAFT_695358 [Trametes meyenii]
MRVEGRQSTVHSYADPEISEDSFLPFLPYPALSQTSPEPDTPQAPVYTGASFHPFLQQNQYTYPFPAPPENKQSSDNDAAIRSASPQTATEGRHGRSVDITTPPAVQSRASFPDIPLSSHLIPASRAPNLESHQEQASATPLSVSPPPAALPHTHPSSPVIPSSATPPPDLPQPPACAVWDPRQGAHPGDNHQRLRELRQSERATRRARAAPYWTPSHASSSNTEVPGEEPSTAPGLSVATTRPAVKRKRRSRKTKKKSKTKAAAESKPETKPAPQPTSPSSAAAAPVHGHRT